MLDNLGALMTHRPTHRWLVAVLTAAMFVAGCASASTDDSADAAQSSTESAADESGDDHGDHDHDDEPTGLREWKGSRPDLRLSLEPDGAGGMVLTIDAPGFTFTPANVTEPVPGEGHAHLYVDGDLLTMIYRRTYVLPQLPPEARQLTVTLSTNDHLEYAVDGEPVAASILLEPAAADATGDDQPPGTEAPVVPDTATIETIEGVVVEVDGDLTQTVSFTLLVEGGDRITFLPTATATFHGGPIAHIRDHLISGAPVVVEYAVLENGTYAALSASDH